VRSDRADEISNPCTNYTNDCANPSTSYTNEGADESSYSETDAGSHPGTDAGSHPGTDAGADESAIKRNIVLDLRGYVRCCEWVQYVGFVVTTMQDWMQDHAPVSRSADLRR
jgi:hypothetical protein